MPFFSTLNICLIFIFHCMSSFGFLKKVAGLEFNSGVLTYTQFALNRLDLKHSISKQNPFFFIGGSWEVCRSLLLGYISTITGMVAGCFISEKSLINFFENNGVKIKTLQFDIDSGLMWLTGQK